MLIINYVEEIGEKPYGGGIRPPPPPPLYVRGLNVSSSLAMKTNSTLIYEF